MKQKTIQKIMTLGMIGSMCLGTALPVMTATTETQTVNETEAAGGTTREAEVTYSQGSTFTVTIPKKMELESATKSSTYAVKVAGDISSDKKVKVAPQSNTFAMKDVADVAVKKADVTATIVQAKTEWSSAEVTTSTETTDNSVTASAITAGSWKGTFTFDIALEDVVATPEA